MAGGFRKVRGAIASLEPRRPGVIGADRSPDAILTAKFSKPFPVTLLPSTIGYYLGPKQGERQVQVLDEIRALGEGDVKSVQQIAAHPR
jgi:hypothetical protein